MKDVLHKRWAAIYANQRFVWIGGRSGYRQGLHDPSAYQTHFSWPSTDDEIGGHLKKALATSRWIQPTADPAFFQMTKEPATYDAWVAGLMSAYGYTAKRSMFKQMALVKVESSGGQIVLAPMVHEKLEAWGRERGDGIEDVVVPESVDEATLGAAVRLALTRTGG